MDKHDKPSKKGCVKPSCKKSQEVKIQYIAPIDIDNEDIKKLLGYFLYYAPNIESVHSLKIENKDELERIYHKMIVDDKNYKFIDKHNIVDDLDLKNYNGDKISIECLRALCAKPNGDKNKRLKKEETKEKETKLECLLRHIRNSIAHGRVVYEHIKNKYYIIFDDVNRNDKLSARIVCNKACLEKWRGILSKYSKSTKKAQNP